MLPDDLADFERLLDNRFNRIWKYFGSLFHGQEKIMAQLDELIADMGTLKNDIANTLQTLNDELAAQKANAANSQPVDLTNAISMVDAMRSSLGDTTAAVDPTAAQSGSSSGGTGSTAATGSDPNNPPATAS